MPSFSDIVKNHQEMRETITQIEALKRQIRTKEKEFNPDVELALRSNQIGISGETNEAKKIIDDLVSNNVGNVVVLLKTLIEGIKSTELSPYNALVLWTDIRPKLRASYLSISIDEASNNLSTILNASQTKKSYTKTEIKTIEELVNVINKEVSVQIYPPLQASDIKAEMSVLLRQLLAALPTAPAAPAAPAAPTGTTPTGTPLPSSSLFTSPPGAPAGAPPPPPVAPPAAGAAGAASPAAAGAPMVVSSFTDNGNRILKEIEDIQLIIVKIKKDADLIANDVESNMKSMSAFPINVAVKISFDDFEKDYKELEKIVKENTKLTQDAIKTNLSIKPATPSGNENVPAYNSLVRIRAKVEVQQNEINVLKTKLDTSASNILSATAGAAAAAPPAGAASSTTPTAPAAATSTTPKTPKTPRQAVIPLEYLFDKDEVKLILDADFVNDSRYKDLKTHLSKLSYVVEEINGKSRNFTIDGYGMSNDKLPEWLATLWLVKSYKESNAEYVNDMFKSTPPKKSLEQLDKALSNLIKAQKLIQSNSKNVLPKLGKAIVSENPKVKPYIDTIFPVKGSGIKRAKKGGGIYNIQQLISRTEDLLSVAQQGHKTPEVRNELDSNLSALIDKKKITPQYRDSIMKKLFGK